jgi:hypothetical protein
VSVPKTEYMQVYTGPASSAPSAQRVTYKGVPIKWTASFRYLGVVFSNDAGSLVPSSLRGAHIEFPFGTVAGSCSTTSPLHTPHFDFTLPCPPWHGLHKGHPCLDA